MKMLQNYFMERHKSYYVLDFNSIEDLKYDLDSVLFGDYCLTYASYWAQRLYMSNKEDFDLIRLTCNVLNAVSVGVARIES